MSIQVNHAVGLVRRGVEAVLWRRDDWLAVKLAQNRGESARQRRSNLQIQYREGGSVDYPILG